MKKTLLKIISIVLTFFLFIFIFGCTTPNSELEPINYTITFKANNASATGSTESITAIADTTVTLTTNGFSLKGYNFKGWNTEADGSGISYTDGASLKLTRNLILYAQWILVPKYTISVLPIANGKVFVSKATSESGKTINVIVEPDEFYDYYFAIYDANYNVIEVVNNETDNYSFIMPASNVTISITFIHKTHYIDIISVEHGSVKIEEYPGYVNEEITVKLFPDQYYTVDEIRISNDNNELISYIYDKSETNTVKFTMPDSQVSIKVTYKLMSYQVSFISDCSEQIPNQEIQRYNTATSVSLSNNSSREGFLGWYTSPDCEDDSNFDFDTPITQDIVLYAKWNTFIIRNKADIDEMHYKCTVKFQVDDFDYDTYLRNNDLLDLYATVLDFSELKKYDDDDLYFEDFKNLEGIILPEGVTSIGTEAFDGCSSLTSITIPDGITSIEYCLFSGCSSLTSITIPDGVTSIGEWAFYGCSSLTSITIPDGVTSIEDGVFYGCSSFTRITIPDSVVSIGDAAFSDCRSLERITIPDRLISIGTEAFYGCRRFSYITIPSSVTVIGERAFSNTILSQVKFLDTDSSWNLRCWIAWTDRYVEATISSTDLYKNEFNNAKLLTETYADYTWTKIQQ